MAPIPERSGPATAGPRPPLRPSRGNSPPRRSQGEAEAFYNSSPADFPEESAGEGNGGVFPATLPLRATQGRPPPTPRSPLHKRETNENGNKNHPRAFLAKPGGLEQPRALLLTQDGTKRNPGAGRNGFSLPSRAAPGGLGPSPRRARCPPPGSETRPLLPGRGKAPLLRAEPGPHLPPPAGSQRGGAGLCGAEGGYMVRRGGQPGRPRSHPPAGSLEAQGWRPRSRLSAEPRGRGSERR